MDKRFVAVLNKKVEGGKILNALGHMAAAIAGTYDNPEEMKFIDYQDKDGGAHVASQNPFIVLRAKNSNQIRTLRNALIEKNIRFVSFTEAMTIGSYQEQLDRSKETPEEGLEYYGVCAFADQAELADLTKKFSLWN